MQFHTWTFPIFFLAALLGYFALRRTRLWVPWLLLASYVFYGWWNPFYLILIVYSTALDYFAAAMIDRCRPGGGGRRFWLVASIVNNLSLLGFFKYADFLIENSNALFGTAFLAADRMMPLGLEYLLPVGISFYTFQSMGYTIDFYRGKIERERNFFRFATYVAFFPQLVAGPIERPQHLLPQFSRPPKVTLRHVSDGASLFLVGLFKKLALANYLAMYVDRVYGSPAEFGPAALLLATFCFAWQIYFDFSGYTDMARGVARVMGFDLMLNFNRPYLATGLGDFWARWHISLSTWFRDYLYVPLGGSRRGEIITYRNLLIVFLVSGLWHGAAWHFIVWGALHAIGVVLTRALERSERYRERFPNWGKRAWVFCFVCFTWIFFRAESITDAWLIIGRIATGAWTDPACPLLMLGLVCAVWIYQSASEMAKLQPIVASGALRVATASAMMLYLLFCSSGGGQFIYFQF